MDDEAYMRLAIAKAREGVAQGQTPFGACIARDGQTLACAHNEVWIHHDITAHAEIQALRQLCPRLKDINLSGATIYCTCEPCPMCFGAIHWAKISRIVYGASIADAQTHGFNELAISSETMKREGGSGIQIIGGCLEEESRELFRLWSAQENKRPY